MKDDGYGNPINEDGELVDDRLLYCFPDCGCDGARLCMAENGASDDALRGNIEGMWSGRTPNQRLAVAALVKRVAAPEGEGNVQR